MADAAIVLMYHRVAAVGPDPHGMQVAPERFAAHLEVLARHADVVRLEEVLERGAGRRVAITFDDGYADNLLAALPALTAAEMPATMFVSSGFVGRTDGFWPDRLAAFLLDRDLPVTYLDLELLGRRVLIDVGSERARRHAYWYVHRLVGGLPAHEIDVVLARLFEAGGVEPTVPVASQPLDAAQLRELASDGTVTIGAHGVTHTRLAVLDHDAQRDEIAGSRAQLESMLDAPVRSFAYPFGSVGAFDATSVDIAREVYDLAVTTEPRALVASTDRYRVPRFNVGDWDERKFAGLLDEWLST